MVKMTKPSPVLPPTFKPARSFPYRVKNGDSFVSIASRLGMTPQALLAFNFNTDKPEYINYYLHHNVGCRVATPDGKNYTFLNANPGIIYYPEVPPLTFFGTKEGALPGLDHVTVQGLGVEDRGDTIRAGAAFGIAMILSPRILDTSVFVYRQFIKGQCRVQDDKGAWYDFFLHTAREPHKLPSSMTESDLTDWSPSEFREDAERHVDPVSSAISIRKYGYREEDPVDIDRYIPHQLGHSYQAIDLPGIVVPKANLRNPKIPGPPSGRFPKAIEAEFHFKGRLYELDPLHPQSPRVLREIEWGFPKKRWRIVQRYPVLQVELF